MSSNDIALKIEQVYDRVTLSGLAVGPEQITLDLQRPNIVRELTSAFAARLDAVHTPGLKLTPRLAMMQLCEIADEAFNTIVRSTMGSRPAAFARLSAITSSMAEYTSRATALGRTIRVDIESTPEAPFLPWEWLGHPAGRPDPDHCRPNDVVRVGVGLLGMGDTRRSLRGEAGSSADEFRSLPKNLQVRVFWNPELDTPHSEMRHFTARGDYDLAGPYPSAPSSWVGSLPDQLADPTHGSGSRDHAVHFTCHHRVEGDPNDPRGLDSVLDFGPGATVTAEQIENGLLDSLRADQFKKEKRPLVFLNLCQGDFVPGSLSSLARLILAWDNPAVVTTMAKIDADFSAAIARQFYARLRQTKSAGDALRGAKLHMLELNQNPLGLIYTLYGNGSFRLVSGDIAAASHH